MEYIFHGRKDIISQLSEQYAKKEYIIRHQDFKSLPLFPPGKPHTDSLLDKYKEIYAEILII